MKSKDRARILLVGSSTKTMVYDMMLSPCSYETQLFVYADADDRCFPKLGPYTERITKVILDFRPHLIIFDYASDIPEFLKEINCIWNTDEKVPILVTGPMDAWYEGKGIDAYLAVLVSPKVFSETVEDLLREAQIHSA